MPTAFANQASFAPVPVLYLPGTSGNYVSTPDSAGLSITGPLEIVSRMSCDWTSASLQAVGVSKWSGGGVGDYLLACTSNVLTYYDGSKYPAGVASSGMGRTANTVYWTKVTHDTATGVVSFYTAADSPIEPTSWTLISSSGATSGVRGDSPTACDACGTYNVGTQGLATGKMYRGILRNGIGGSIAADWNGTLSPGQRQRDSAGNIWTVNGSAWSVTAG